MGRATSRIACVCSPRPRVTPIRPVVTDNRVGIDIHERTISPVDNVPVQPKPSPVPREIPIITMPRTTT